MPAISPSLLSISFTFFILLPRLYTQKSPEFDPARMVVWQADLVKDDIRGKVPAEGCDFLLILFVLSAVNPQNMDLFLEHALHVAFPRLFCC